MHRPIRLAAALAFTLVSGLAVADSGATKDEAVAMVKKGITFIKANGVDKGYAAISEKGGQFSDRDLYLVVYGLDGKCLAHGANPKQIGKDLIDLTDIDGKYFVKERVELAKANYVEHKQINQQLTERESGGVTRRADVEQSLGRLALAESNLLTEVSNLHDVSARYLRLSTPVEVAA